MRENSYKFIDSYINKTVEFNLHRINLKLCLSLSLFSSNKIDDGTRLLLESVIKRIDPSKIKNAIDVGCGMGVLGIFLKKFNPAIELIFQDKDALALAFTQENCRLNHIKHYDIAGSLALQSIKEKEFDLIISNIPAKAGEPVLEDIIKRGSQMLSSSGIAAIVVIKPLEELIENYILMDQNEIIYKAGNKRHAIFHYRKQDTGQKAECLDLLPYIRDNYEFNMNEISYCLETAYSLPDFDRLSFLLKLAMDMINNEKIEGKVLFWNPGQGHLPVFVSQKNMGNNIEYFLGSRDLLSLEVTKNNLLSNGISEDKIRLFHVPTFMHVMGKFDHIILFPDNDIGVPLDEVILPHSYSLICDKGRILIADYSTYIFRFLKACKYQMLKDKKYKGFRAVIVC